MRMNNVFLIGPPGAGKTTIGRGLARELGLNFLDTDQEIETRAGVDIAWIHDVEGEEGFAKREEKIISELSEQTGILLATGATAIHSSSNRRHLSARGTVVYLNVSIEAQLSRMERDKRRPLMQTGNKREVLEGIMQETAHLYDEIADVTFITEGQSIKVVIQQIVEKLRAL